MCETQVCKYSMFHTLLHQHASAKIEIKLHAMTTDCFLWLLEHPLYALPFSVVQNVSIVEEEQK